MNIGTTILQYKIGEKLGSGGMGDVYRGEDTRLGRSVALKFLSSENRSDPEKRQRLFQEARAASLLRSPHVAVIHDIIEHEDRLFIVMELVEGELLTQKVERGPMPPLEAIDIAMQTSEALEEAHSLGIIHRDIKPANIMITPRGLVKVLDFGIAKQLKSAAGPGRREGGGSKLEDLTSTGMILGTFSYMSPEQALGRQIDHRTDIFSLGVVLYQMVTGTLPFHGENWGQTIQQILNREPAPPSQLNAGIPEELSQLIQRTLVKDPERRVSTASQLEADLGALRSSLEAVSAADPSGGNGSRKHSTRLLAPPPQAQPAAAAPGENSVAVFTFSNLQREPTEEWIGTGIAETVTADLQNIRGLKVIGRGRVHEVLKNLGSGVEHEPSERFSMDAGRRLGATYVVRGAYQRMGDLVRITAHFGEVKSGKLLKTVKVDGKIQDIFQMQDKIVYGLMQGLEIQLESSEIARIEARETQSVEAYECCSQATLNLRTGDRDALDRAIALYEKAISLDPRYAEAWSGLAAANSLKGAFLGIRELQEKAVLHARRAIEINPRLAAAHSGLGAALSGLGLHDEAIQAIREALRLEPANHMAHGNLARAYWMGQGKVEEGIAELEKCVELNPESGYAYLQLAFLHALRRDLARGEAAAAKAVELQEKSLSGSEGLKIVGGHSRLGYIHYLQGNAEAAIREYERELEFLSTSDHALRERTLIEIHQKLGAAWLKKGDREQAERWLDRALKAYERRLAQGTTEPFTSYYAACAYALRGDARQALEALTIAVSRLGPLNKPRAKADPDLESLRADPGFIRLVA